MFRSDPLAVKTKHEINFTFFSEGDEVSGAMRARASTPRRGHATTRRFKQARAERTYEALLAAAGEIFAEVGYDGAQTPDIARRAGVSTGAFYRYFDDKRQAFLEVVTRRLEQATTEVLAELKPERFRPTSQAGERRAIELVLDVLFDQIRRDAPFERVLLEMSLRDPEVMAIRARFDALGLGILTQMIEDIIPRRVVPNARAAALVIHSAALEIGAERAGLSTARGAGLRDAEVREALREMIHRYLYPR
jgi:AcrR family transcriptional regulator